LSFGFIEKGRTGMSPTISDRSVVVAAKDQVSCDLAGEAAILNVKSGEPRAVVEIQSAITSEYDVEPERCAADLTSLLEELLAEGLIEVKDRSGA
jgi:hypothetical protein